MTALLAEHDLDLSRDLIPVAPVAHYFIGGVVTDVWGRTTVPGLYAAGEVASTGVHGANRLASNSLLEGLVFGDRVVRHLDRYIGGLGEDVRRLQLRAAGALGPPARHSDIAAVRRAVTGLMSEQGRLAAQRGRPARRPRGAARHQLGAAVRRRPGRPSSSCSTSSRWPRRSPSAPCCARRRAACTCATTIPGATTTTGSATSRCACPGTPAAREPAMTAGLRPSAALRAAAERRRPPRPGRRPRRLRRSRRARLHRARHGRASRRAPPACCRASPPSAPPPRLVDPDLRGQPSRCDAGDALRRRRHAGHADRPRCRASSPSSAPASTSWPACPASPRSRPATWPRRPARGAVIAGTRKTTPGLRALEKQAVVDGGGSPHRFGLFDGAMIKDNHVAAAGGLAAAVAAVRAGPAHAHLLEVEVDTLDAARRGARRRRAGDPARQHGRGRGARGRGARRRPRRASRSRAASRSSACASYAEAGVDVISVGALTTAAPWIDLSLELEDVTMLLVVDVGNTQTHHRPDRRRRDRRRLAHRHRAASHERRDRRPAAGLLLAARASACERRSTRWASPRWCRASRRSG